MVRITATLLTFAAGKKTPKDPKKQTAGNDVVKVSLSLLSEPETDHNDQLGERVAARERSLRACDARKEAEIPTPDVKRRAILFRLNNNRNIVPSSSSQPIYPSQRIIDAIHAPETQRRCDFPLLLLLCFCVPFFHQTPSVPGALEAFPLKFLLSALIKCDRLAKGAHDRSSDGRRE